MEGSGLAPVEASGNDNPWDHLRYASFVKDLERARPEDLLKLAKQLAYDHFVVQPAMKRLLMGLGTPRPRADVEL